MLVLGCWEPGSGNGRARALAPGPTPSSLLLALETVALDLRNEAGDSISLEADEILHAKRAGAGGFITYHDLSELRLRGARIAAQRPVHVGFSRVVSDLFEALEALRGAPIEHATRAQPGEPASAGNEAEAVRSSGPRLSRALFAPLVWNEETDHGRIEIVAERARLDLASGMLVLEGAVQIDSPRGEHFEARQAVLTRGERGLFLPLGHRRGDDAVVQDAVFLVAGRDGRLRASQGVPSRSYEDLIERRERIVLTHYAEHAPPTLRPILHALLAQRTRIAPPPQP